MGFGRGLKVPLWALMLVICCIQQKASGTEGVTGKVTIIPPLTTTPVVTSFNPAHNGQVCSTWGNFHFKTFDGDIYYFPGLCNYVFSSHCHTAFEDFNIQIRRTMTKNNTSISSITIRIDGVDIEIQLDTILVNGERIQMPYTGSGFVIQRFNDYVKMTAKMGVNFMWNEKDSVMLELDEKYANQTCGLCGDFNGIPTYNEFYSNNAYITALQFGNMQKLNGPTEDCEDPTLHSLSNCTDEYDLCRNVLTGPEFSECNYMVGVNEYIEACIQDLCLCDQPQETSCLCDTFAEYSRQCAHAGGSPQNWRTPELCPKACPFNMEYQECGSPCGDTCTNSERSQLCEDHCADGCFCPSGTVYDDINDSGCIPLEQCSCVFNRKSYAPGTTYSDNCRSCSCTGGQWSCTDLPCPGICSVEGGSHISTYDEKRYDVHGDCTYVLSKVCEEDTFTVLGELRQCGLTETETCLKMVALTINGGQSSIVVKPDGGVFLNWIYTQLPISAANMTIFRPSTFFITVETNFGLQLQIQTVPMMQLFIHLDPSFKEKTCGLCGNFDSRQTDDFKAISGVVEGTAPAFANTWKTQAACPNIKQNFEDPCTLSIENEKYAHHWCGLLTDTAGPFAKCHPSVNPATYQKNCIFDTCNCERSEDCMCAALSSYVRACASKGVELPGWRATVCTKYTTSCPKSLNYSYTIRSCQPTCRSLSEPDVTCNIEFTPVDGCTCESGTYLDDSGKCVPANQCPCYYKGTPVLSGEVIHDLSVVCTCSQGKLNCIGNGDPTQVCVAPMVYFDCRNATAGSTGAECQKSCQTLDMHCYSTQCVSGCMCPAGLVSDGKGGCITMEECPCIHNDATYKPGEKIKVDCNTCVCKNRMWKCTMERCLGTCAVYGDGHVITFDDKRYNFNGKCEYTLVQDHCGQNSSSQGTFRIITENVPCGTTGTTCSKTIKLFYGNYELILTEEHHEIVQRGDGGQIPYRIRYMGIYLVIETNNGLILLWDKKTTIFMKLSDNFKGQICGLCGNYDGNGINDFTTRSQSVVGNVLEFGNSWKVSPTCPDAKCTKDPCSKNPYRKSWSQKQCSIINSKVFAACHSQVEPTKYYEACVTDACACDTGGDCECFCTAVAAYAQACSEFGVCISWRTPSVCPMFCDYYNGEGECDWHFKSCGAPCMKTCRNPSGRCLYQLPGLEGCYPYCPADKPYFNEDEMKCVAVCGCYDDQDTYYPVGTTFNSKEKCQSCECTSRGIECRHDDEACYCYYEGKAYNYKDVIYNTTDGLGWCILATCDINGTIDRELYKCNQATTTPPFSFTTTPPATPSEAGSTTQPVTTTCVHRVCEWTEWFDVSYPNFGQTNGDYETPENIRAKGHNMCKMPDEAECRAQRFPNENLNSLNQNILCSKTDGLICNNKDQTPPICYNYEIRFLCCNYITCGLTTSTPIITTEQTATSSQTTESQTTKPAMTGLTTEIQTKAPAFSTGYTQPIVTVTTKCQPRCQWTTWFDVDRPTSSRDSGDRETYQKIRAQGGEVCDAPQDIECRAEDYRDVSLDLLGQKLQCNTAVGLECNNADQTGKFNMCFNYEIRFLCCNYDHCQQGTTMPASTTARTTAATASTPGATTHPPSSTGSTPPPHVPTTPPSTTVVSTAHTTGAMGTTHSAKTPLPPSTTSTPVPHVTTTPQSTTVVSTAHTTAAPTSATTLPSSSTGSTPPPPVSTTAESTTVVSAATTTVALTSSHSATTPPSSSPGSTQPTTTICQLRCQWTTWFDVDRPTSSPDSGDRETYQKIRAQGGEVCDAPQDIECRAEDYRDVSLDLLGQKLQCNTAVGLECNNADQTGKFKMCYNYEIRFLCCNYDHCQPGTTIPASTTARTTAATASTPGATTHPPSSTGSTPLPHIPTTPSTTVVSTTRTTEAPGTTPSAKTPLPPSTTSTPVPHVTTTPQSTTVVSTAHTTAAPTSATTLPSSSTGSTPPPPISTTAESTTVVSSVSTTAAPSSSLSATTPPSSSTGSVPPPPITTTTESTTVVSAATITAAPSSSLSATTPPSSSTGSVPPPPITTTTESTTVVSAATTTAAPTSSYGATTPPSSSPGSPQPTTTICQQRCQWTTWFDVDRPTSSPDSGDRETYQKIRAQGGEVCDAPQNIECRAEDYRDVSLDLLGQKLQCNTAVGLECNNADQTGKFKMCYNYEIRFLCCNYDHCQPGTTMPASTTARTTAATASTPGATTHPPSSTGSTPLPHVPTTPSTTVVSTTRTTEAPGTTPSAKTPLPPSTTSTPVPHITTTPQSTTVVSTAHTTAAPTSATTLPSSSTGSTPPPPISTTAESTTVVSSVSTTAAPSSSLSATTPPSSSTGSVPPPPITTTTESTTVVSAATITAAPSSSLSATTPPSSSTGSVPPPPVTTTTESTTVVSAATTTAAPTSSYGATTPPSSSPGSPQPTTTICQQRCQWTTWFDVDRPTSSPDSGDRETYQKIRAQGGEVCDAPQDIECRAENYRDVSLDLLGQKLQCNTAVGLECNNADQTGKFKMCYNYEIRFLCCNYDHCQPGTTMPASTTARTTAATASTPGATTHPPSSTGSTPLPHVPTTPSTTVVSTTRTTEAPGTTPSAKTPLPPSTTSTPVPHITTTPQSTTVVSTAHTTAAPTSATTLPSSSTGSTPPPPISTTAESTTVVSSVSTTAAPSSSLSATTPPSSSTGSVPPPPITTTTESTTVVSAATITAAPSSSLSATTPPSSSTGSVPPPPVTTTTESTTVVSAATTTAAPTSSYGATTPPSSSPGSPQPTTTICQQRCQWTTWFDVDRPTSSPDSGDRETYQKIRAQGGEVCDAPQDIECRAEDYRDVSLDLLGQKLQCNTAVGLECNNADQTGKFKMCYNYEIRFLCCNYDHCQPGTTMPASTTARTTAATASTPGATTHPPSSTGSTPLPHVPTTPSTTVVSTTRTTEAPGTTPSAKTPLPPSTTSTPVPHITTTPQSTTVVSTAHTTAAPTSATTLPSSSTGSTPPPPISTTAESTTVVSSVSTTAAPSSSLSATTPPSSSTGSVPPPPITTTTESTTVVSAATITAAPSSSLSATTPPSSSTGSVPPPPVTTTTESTTVVSAATTTAAPTSSYGATTPPSSSPGSPQPTTTICQQRCQWTTWFDVDRPTSSPDSGDRETYQKIRAQGGEVCDAPQDIECRAEDYRDVSLDLLGQKLQCNTAVGLECNNADQTGKFIMCYNYEIRFLCCNYDHCQPGTTMPASTTARTTAATASTPGATTHPPSSTSSTPLPHVPTTPPSTTVVSTTRTTEAPGTTPSAKTPLPPSTTSTPVPHVTTTPQSTTVVSTAHTTAAPTSATTLPSSSTGSTPPPPISTTAESTTVVSSVSTTAAPSSSLSATTPPSSSTGSVPPPPVTTTTESTTVVSAATTTAAPTSSHGATTPPSSSPGSPQPATTICQQQCQWTTWFDVDRPTSSRDSGDRETYQKIRAQGGEVCDAPQDIECRAEDYRDVSLDLLGQKLQCNIAVGLECNNADQTGKFNMCYNYEIRFLCCNYDHCQLGTTMPASTTARTTAATASTPGTTTHPPSSPGSTPPPHVPTTPPSTTVVSTARTTGAMGTTPSAKTPLPPSTTSTPVPHITTTPQSTTVVSTAHTTAAPTSATTLPSSSTGSTPPPPGSTTAESTTVVSAATTTAAPTSSLSATTPPSSSTGSVPPPPVTTTTESTTVVSAGTTTAAPTSSHSATTPPSSSTGSVPPPPVTTTTESTTVVSTATTTAAPTSSYGATTPPSSSPGSPQPTTTICQQRCQWTTWFDVDRPTSSPDSGDRETYQKIRAQGGEVCDAPQDIECRAEDYRDVSLDLLGQKLQCNTAVGLECNNADQTGKFKMCYNYEIRFLCCNYDHCQPGTTMPASTTARTTAATASTPGATTHPPSSTGSTPLPHVPTTPSTTVVSTTRTTEAPGTTPSAKTPLPPSTTSTPVPLVTTTPQSTTVVSTAHTTAAPTSATTLPSSSTGSTPPPPISTTAESTTVVSTVSTTAAPSSSLSATTPPSSSTGSVPPPPITTTTESTTVVSAATTTAAPSSSLSATTPPSSSTGSVPPPPVSTTMESTTVVSTATTTAAPTSSLSATTPPSSSTGSVPPPPVTTTTESTTVVSAATTTAAPSSSLSATTPPSSSTGSVPPPPITTTTESTTVVSAATTTAAPASSLSATTPPSSSTGSVPPPPVTTTTESTTVVSAATTTAALTSSHSATTPPSSSPGSPQPATTICQLRCQWTTWFDVDHPTSSRDSGDRETFQKIRAQGGEVCDAPQDIECRAEDYRDVSLDLLGQKLQCNTAVGLECNNADQTGEFNMCYNYQVRFQCCNYDHCQPGTTTPASTTTRTTATTASTPGATTHPPSSTGSTPPPHVPTTRPSTTVVSTARTTGAPGTTPSAKTPQPPSTTSTPVPHVTTTPQSTTVVSTTHITAAPTSATTLPSSSTGSTPPPPGSTTAESTTVVSTVSTTAAPNSSPSASTLPSSSTGSTPPPPISTTTESTAVVSTSHVVTPGKPTTVSPPLSTVSITPPASVNTPSVPPVSTVSATSLESTPLSKPAITLATETTIPQTTAVTVLTRTAASSTATASTSSTEGTVPVTLSTTTPCFCHVSGVTADLFSPGETIYNRTDSAGCRFYAVCNKHCEIERFQEPCPSTTPSLPSSPSVTTEGTSPVPSTPQPTVFIPSTSLYTTSVMPSKPAENQGCINTEPPRKINETWMLNNCTMATCEGNDKIVVMLPPPVDNITCASGLPPIKIEHKDGCTYHYECKCVCSGWDYSQYSTFDGTRYTFQDSCTYILVKEIVNNHENFSVVIDNGLCDAASNQSCSRSIIVNYDSMKIVLTSQMHDGVRTNKVIFNNEVVNGGFRKDGILVTNAGNVMSVEILDIQAFISFDGLTFSIQLPYRVFQHNTEGQCGVCSNDRSDDCRLPSGHEASSCSEMAYSWKVYDQNKPYCGQTTPTPVTPTKHPTPTPCVNPSPLCELILSNIFADCHEVLPPSEFYSKCISDECQTTNGSLTCHHIEMYASLCTANGFCSDWRSKTQGKCSYHCPKDKVYDACGPLHPATCDNGQATSTDERFTEGCFCPEDKILFNSYSGICVPRPGCACVGPDGLPKLPGTKWRSDCQECVCEPLSLSVQCKPVACPTSSPATCEKDGFIPVPVLTPEDVCCPTIQCQCNVSACSNKMKTCEPGFQLASVLFEGDCCVTFKCVPIPDVCVVNGTVYKPEATVPSGPCETCICSSVTSPASNRNAVECTPIKCNTDCPTGYEYQAKSGECCGKCIQVACIIKFNDTTELLQPGDIWKPEANNCSQYECEEIEDTFVLVNVTRKCPIIHPDECDPSEIELTPDGCCETCRITPQKDCKVQKNQTLIRQNECISSEVIELTYCEGACPSSSVYSIEAKAMQHKCTCCQELKSHRRQVTLTCQDGRSINYDYIYVDECQCMTACIPGKESPFPSLFPS